MSPLIQFLSVQQMTYDLSSIFVSPISTKSVGGMGNGQKEKQTNLCSSIT